MKAKLSAIALIVGSVIMEYICFKNIYILKYPGKPTVLIFPVFFFITGVILLIFSKNRKNTDDKDEQ